jgi:nucleotide-binding universal stress UspA family protein
MSEPTADNRIVVGVDGSEASVAAVCWAVRQAHALRAEVVAVHAWERTASALAPYAPTSAHPGADEERVRAARLLAGTLREVFGPRVDRSVRAAVVEGPPARVLLRYSRGAQLLVLGRTTRHEYGLPAIGAVGRDCLRHATVPVVTVPSPERSAPPLKPVGARTLAARGPCSGGRKRQRRTGGAHKRRRHTGGDRRAGVLSRPGLRAPSSRPPTDRGRPQQPTDVRWSAEAGGDGVRLGGLCSRRSTRTASASNHAVRTIVTPTAATSRTANRSQNSGVRLVPMVLVSLRHSTPFPLFPANSLAGHRT